MFNNNPTSKYLHKILNGGFNFGASFDVAGASKTMIVIRVI